VILSKIRTAIAVAGYPFVLMVSDGIVTPGNSTLMFQHRCYKIGLKWDMMGMSVASLDSCQVAEMERFEGEC
jgi:hypothetical protein